MAEAAVDTSKKADEGGGGTPVDKILAKLDSISARQDAIDARHAADTAKADAKAKKDGDLTLEHEGTEKKEVQGGEVPPIKMDGKKDAAAKGDEFPPKDEEKEKADAAAKAKADADKGKKADGKGEDDQEAEIAKGDARADAIEVLRQEIAALRRERDMPDDDLAKYADAQARADSVAQLFGKQAPRWMSGETLPAYERRLVNGFRQHSKAWSDVKMSELPDNAFRNAKEQIYADAISAAAHPTDLTEGEHRRVTITDPDTGLKKIEWRGERSFIADLGRPGRRVAAFRNRNFA